MNPLVSLAKSSVETYIKEGKIIIPGENLPEEYLSNRAGTFVTIDKNGELCGCIGTYLPTRKNIAEEVIYNAISAATEDYRFEVITKEELPHLSYTVYVLKEPELIKDPSELNPKKFGIIIRTVSENKTGVKSALLLPDLEGVDTVEQQIHITCQKGGINPDKEKIIIYKFIADKFN